MWQTEYYRGGGGWYVVEDSKGYIGVDFKTLPEKHKNVLMLIDASGIYATGDYLDMKVIKEVGQAIQNAVYQKGFQVYIYCTTKKVSITEGETK